MNDILNATIDATQNGPVDPNAGAFKVANLSAGTADMSLSSQWYNRPADQRFLSLPHLHGYTKRRYEASETMVVKNNELEFFAPSPDQYQSIADSHLLGIRLPDNRTVVPTHWSFQQMSGLAKAPAGYLRTLPGYVVAENWNVGMHLNRQVETVKTYFQPDGSTELHAVTGPDYGRIPDHEVVEAVQQVAGNGVGDSSWKVPGVMDWSDRVYRPNAEVTTDTTTLFASDRDVFMFLVDDLHPIEVGKTKGGDPDLMFRGFYVRNSEVGKSTMEIATMYLRALCMNRILWGVEGFQKLSIRHSKNAPARFMMEALPALKKFAEGSVANIVEGVEKAKAAKVASNDDKALEFLQGRGFSRNRSREIFDRVVTEEDTKPRTAWDFAQGITAVARDIPQQDQRLEMEQVAGNILNSVAQAA